jgi:hypothetical protein
VRQTPLLSFVLCLMRSIVVTLTPWSYVSDGVYFRFGNTDPTHTKSGFAAAIHPFLRGIGGIRHDVIQMWEVPDGCVGGSVVATMDVHYTRLNRQRLVLPCCKVFRVHDGLVYDYSI